MSLAADRLAADRRKAELLVDKNRLSEAEQVCRRLCKRAPNDSAAWHLLGTVLTRMGNHQEAERVWQHAAALCPDDATLLINLAHAQQAQGNIQAASAVLQRVVQIDPAHPDAWLALGRLSRQINRQDQAIACYQRVIALQPGHFGAQADLGNIFFELGRMEEAIDCYRKASSIEPANVMVYCNLGMALSTLARRQEAVDCYRRALELAPDSAEVHLALGSTLSASGDFRGALDAYRNAERLKPNYVDAQASVANLLERLGRHEEAHEIISRLIGNGLLNTALAVAYAAISRHFNEEAAAVSLIDKILAAGQLSSMQQLELHFAAGGLLDDLAQFDLAFSHYEKGNALAPRRYGTEADRNYFDDIMRAYSIECMKQAPRSRLRTDKPVFIVGMPRSGTSLVEQILASHPQVYGAGELQSMQRISERIAAKLYELGAGCVSALERGAVDTLAGEQLAYLEDLAPTGTARITDKMPHNFLHLGLIKLLFPDARIIHCMRDPLDTCLSIYFQHFGGSNDYAYNLSSLGEHYCRYHALMEHWNALGIEMYTVRYEELVSEPEINIRGLIDCLGLDWDSRCLNFHKSSRQTVTASYGQVRNPIHTGSIGRWKHYEKHLRSLAAMFRENEVL